MIDLHAHCLPGIDDGAKTADISVAMLKDSLAQGVTCCVATPHCRLHNKDAVEVFLKKRDEAAEILASHASGDLPELFFGAEVFLDNDISVYDDLSKLCLGQSRYLLMELPVSKPKLPYGEWLYNLSLKKIIPVIAHIERYNFFEPLMDELEAFRPVYQINADMFLSFFGRRFIKKMLKRDGRFVIASDMHSNVHRKNHMKEAMNKARRIMEPYRAEELFHKTAADILGL